MSIPLVDTKLHIPPVRPELVPRPRLLERLDAGLFGQGGLQKGRFARKLTLISASAGFGKTTLLSEWTGDCGQPVARVSLDKGDNDPTRFWAYFIAAVQTIPSLSEAGVGETALAALESPQPPPLELVLTALINEGDRGRPEIPEPSLRGHR